MQSVSVAEAKDRLPFYLHLAEQGERIEITRHGKPIAVLSSLQSVMPERKPSAFETAYLQFRKKVESDESYTEEFWKNCFEIPRATQIGPRHEEDFR